MKIGMYGGKFTPVHMGHVYTMIKASTLVDELHVIVSYDEEYEKSVIFKDAKISHIPYRIRVRWWIQITKDMPHVHVHAIEEPQTGHKDDWKFGATKIKEAIGKPIDKVFSSENAYTEIFNDLYPDAEHVVIDAERLTYNISATKIRTEGVMKHWDMLPRIVQPYFIKKVVIVGTESCGKSTLVRNLANLYNTDFVEEYGRTFYEMIGDCEGVTLKEDYPTIAFEHKHYERLKADTSRKLLFIDTEVIVTQYFCEIYLQQHLDVLDQMAKLQKYDLWLFLEPDVKWVDDGTRSFGEQSVREKNSQYLKKMLDSHSIDYKIIKGNYNERLSKAVEYVNELLR